MNRRAFLRYSMGASALALLPGCRFSFEQGLFNPCGPALPKELANHPLVAAAWEGLKADAVWDCHVHLFGNGRSRTGIWVSPDFDHPTGIASKVRHTMFASGGCLGEDEALWDQRMVERLNLLIDGFPRGAKTML